MWSESLPCTWWLYYVACSSIVWSCYRSYSSSSPEAILIGLWKVLGTPWWQRLESHPGLWHVYASIFMKTYAEYNYSPRNDPQTWNHRPQFHPDMIPTPLVTSTPKWSPVNHWNEMVFRHGIITTLLQRVRSWIAFNIHYFLALWLSNRLSVYFCIFKVILKM